MIPRGGMPGSQRGARCLSPARADPVACAPLGTDHRTAPANGRSPGPLVKNPHTETQLEYSVAHARTHPWSSHLLIPD